MSSQKNVVKQKKLLSRRDLANAVNRLAALEGIDGPVAEDERVRLSLMIQLYDATERHPAKMGVETPTDMRPVKSGGKYLLILKEPLLKVHVDAMREDLDKQFGKGVVSVMYGCAGAELYEIEGAA